MSWSLSNTSGTTAGGTGASGVDGSVIKTYDNASGNDPYNSGVLTTQEQYDQYGINVDNFQLWFLAKNTDPAVSSNWVDEGIFKGTDGIDGIGYDGASYDPLTGQVTFSGQGGNADVVTGDLRGADGTSSTYLTGAGAPTDNVTGTDGDLYVDTDTGDFYGPRAVGAWGTSSLNINGQDGVDVTDADSTSGDLIITLSNGSEINAGEVLGASGGTPNITIGSVTTGASGSSALVELDGDSTALNKILNFTIPRGADGVSGADGTDGTTFTKTEIITRDSGDIGQIHVDSENGSLYQKKETTHVSSITISFADYSIDDNTFDPNGLYEFTGFYETADGRLRAQYELDKDNGSPAPDYKIIFDESENEWELISNTDPVPPPLARCPDSNIEGKCGVYLNTAKWSVENQHYPNSTLPSVTATEVKDAYITLKEKAVTQVGSYVNEGSKTALTIPQKKGYVRGVPYFGNTHREDGVLMTGAIHNDASQVIEESSSLSIEWKLDKVHLEVTEACEVLIYAKTSDNIVVTDDDSVGLGASYTGVYELQTTPVSGKNAYKNGNDKWITWDTTNWAIRDTSGGASIRVISSQEVEDPSTLTRSETNLINIYPERKTLKVGALSDNSGNTHTNTGTSETISFGSSFSGEIYLEELNDTSGYPEVYFQLLTKDEVNFSVSYIKYLNLTTCWEKIVDVANPDGLTLGGLTNVNVTADSPNQDGQLIRWNEALQEWTLTYLDSSAWYGGYETPNSKLGSDGDYHFNFLTKDISRKEDGAWVVRVNTASGADGVSISTIEENDGSEEGKPAFSLTITLDDGTEFTTSSLKGDTGANGSAGGLPTGGDGSTTGTGTGDQDYTPAMDNSEFWIDSSKASTITSNVSGILTWADAYAQGVNMVNESTTNFPALSSYTGVTAGFTALDVVTLDAVTDTLKTNTNPASTNGDFNLFGVFQIDATDDGIIIDYGGGVSGSIQVVIDGGDLKLIAVNNSGTSGTTALATSVSTGDVFLLGIKARSADYEVRLNGALIGSAITEDITGTINAKDFSIGDPSGSITTLSKHCEWILGLAHITDSQATQKEGYLAHKWGITDNLDASHPNKTTKPIIAGGSSGQVLVKIGDGDYDVAWVDQTPYNRFITTGVDAQYDVDITSHGATILADGKLNAMDVILPYDPADGWQCNFINRNDFPVRLLSKDAGGATDNIIPDGGWAVTGDLTSASWLKNNGDACTATWDATGNTWLVIGNVRTYEDAFAVSGTIK